MSSCEPIAGYFREPVQAWLRAYKASMLMCGDCVASLGVAEATPGTERPDALTLGYYVREAALETYAKCLNLGCTPREARTAYNKVFDRVGLPRREEL